MRWCFLGSHEIPDGERMVMPTRGGAHICVPCSQTARGQRLMQEDFNIVDGYNPRGNSPRRARLHAQSKRDGVRHCEACGAAGTCHAVRPTERGTWVQCSACRHQFAVRGAA